MQDVEWSILRGARDRCYNPNNREYHRYGGRGIEYRLPEDMNLAVEELVRAIGPRPEGMSLDRIDNDGHYEIGNLRWANYDEQQQNQSQPRKSIDERLVAFKARMSDKEYMRRWGR